MTKSSDSLTLQGLSSDNVWDYENGFHWFSDNSRLMHVLSHYELYKSTSGLPGDVIECGVFKAVSLIRWASFRRALETDSSRKIIGFDVFGPFPGENLTSKEDVELAETFNNDDGEALTVDEFRSVMERKGFQNIQAVEGNIFQTLPKYLEDNPQTRVSLLHLDMDVKPPTEFALNLLWDRMVPGGLILADDYNGLAGATDAFQEFAQARGLALEKPLFDQKPAFIRVPLHAP
ncbi:MAG: TylF/MycF/NovP-related O-methyltransferase [Rhodospirillales bacterium]